MCFVQHASHVVFPLAQSGKGDAFSLWLSPRGPGLPYLCTSSEGGTLPHQSLTLQFPYMVSEQDAELGIVIKCYFVWFLVDQLRRKVARRRRQP